jgi:hypothetical protein
MTIDSRREERESERERAEFGRFENEREDGIERKREGEIN